MKKLILLTIVVATLVIPFGTKAINLLSVSNAKITVTEPKPIELYVEKLAYKESSGKENIVILDINGKYSYGCLQFQRDTFERYSKKYGVQGGIMECETQKLLAKLILQNEKNGWRNWYTSVKVRGLGLPPSS